MSNVGLYLGTFNPIHNGHVTLTEYFSSLPELDEVLVVISPQSPFKSEEELIGDYERLEMAETVFKKFDNVRVSDIEFKMSRPNFTIDTLKEFKRRHRYNKLILFIGEDNLAGFNNWKDYKKIIEIAEVYVYPRDTNQKIPNDILSNNNIKLVDAPKIKISSSHIRELLKSNQKIDDLVPKEVLNFFKSNPQAL
jgi:nicotinate-nucleotide adenylyltransferase